MTAEDKEKKPGRLPKKTGNNFALYAVIAVAVLYGIIRLVLHFTQGE